MTAVQLKLRDPDAVVTVLEKHAIYTRAHVLDLRPSSFLGIPTAAEPSLASKIVQQTPARTKALLGSVHQNLTPLVTEAFKMFGFGKKEANRSPVGESDRIPSPPRKNLLELAIERWSKHAYVERSNQRHRI